jgi:hypothetical protein
VRLGGELDIRYQSIVRMPGSRLVLLIIIKLRGKMNADRVVNNGANGTSPDFTYSTKIAIARRRLVEQILFMAVA